jgi:hypothetical protein
MVIGIMAMNRASASQDVQLATVPCRGCQFNPESIPLSIAVPPNAALDKAIPEDQIRKVNGGSALAVALLTISR